MNPGEYFIERFLPILHDINGETCFDQNPFGNRLVDEIVFSNKDMVCSRRGQVIALNLWLRIGGQILLERIVKGMSRFGEQVF